MINTLGKLLVLLHTTMSVMALTYALIVIVQDRDFGWMEPGKEPIAFGADGTPTKWVRTASALDKSRAALIEANRHRETHYAAVKPALESLQEAEPYLSENHLFYREHLARLEGKEKLKDGVRRLKNGGIVLELPAKLDAKTRVGKPVFEDDPTDLVLADGRKIPIEYALDAYEEQRKELHKQIEEVQKEIVKINADTRKFTTELIGTDDDNKYIQPGLYDLIELEYKAQTRLKEELEDIKQPWSTYLEQARQHMFRRTDLEATLQRLKNITPKVQKKL